MRISEKIKIVEIKSRTKDIICNKCRGSCKSGMSGSIPDYDGLLETSITGGYHSKLGDEVTYTFSICEKCLKELFDTFSIPPEISYNGCQQDGMPLDWTINEYNLTDRCLKIISKDENFKEFKESFIYLCSVDGFCYAYPADDEKDIKGFLEYLASNDVNTNLIKII